MPFSDSEDSDEDAFAALSRRKANKRKKKNKSQEASEKKVEPKENDKVNDRTVANDGDNATTTAPSASNLSNTRKRHYNTTNAGRKSKMDALLQELQTERVEKEKVRKKRSSSDNYQHQHHQQQQQRQSYGSFVQPEHEDITTNLFVGNLAPTIAEEELSTVFGQFGELFSIKVMWPRTMEERQRQRHSGFVCFVHRSDAAEALHQLDETDPFGVGRRIMVRWGKYINVPKHRQEQRKQETEFARNRRGSRDGDTHEYDRCNKRPRASSEQSQFSATSQPPTVDDISMEQTDNTNRPHIRVMTPKDIRRVNFISTVAQFVAKDGIALEQALFQQHQQQSLMDANNSMDFIWTPSQFRQRKQGETVSSSRFDLQRQEHIYYKWRVYSFSQGDTFFTWQTQPFVMLQYGSLWHPPPLDKEASRREQEAQVEHQQNIERQQHERRLQSVRRDYMTGRQLEQARNNKRAGAQGGATLEPEELDQANRLFRHDLCASRQAICKAMAFCFEKSAAAQQISAMIHDLLLEPHSDVEVRIARLYLLSDILFNSQQPGVRNAFCYRDAIERMAPQVFAALGKHGDGQAGRMTMNKLSSAARAVLNAWSDWNAFHPGFLDELRDRFGGKEIVDRKPDIQPTKDEKEEDDDATKDEGDAVDKPEPIRAIQQGTWKTVDHNEDEEEENRKRDSHGGPRDNKMISGAARKNQTTSKVGDACSEEEADGEPLGDEDIDGALLVDNVDGEAMDDPDGEPLEGIDGESVDGANLDGDDEDVDGSPLVEGTTTD